MEQFINDEIDMILDEMAEDEDTEFELTEWQREQIFIALRDGYDHIWEDLYDAINEQISKYID